MNTKQALSQARALIENPEHWTQGEAAIENTGAACSPHSLDAYAFCASGAMQRAAGDTHVRLLCVRAMTLAAHTLFPGVNSAVPFIGINDGDYGIPDDVTTDAEFEAAAHANILRLFDHAISAS